jgi:hypothetical protein
MNIAIMQPYFLPYIGYWQLMAAVDTFVVYDDIEYTKKGWINRNRYLSNGKDLYFSIPIKKAPDQFFVSQRYVAECYKKDKFKILKKISEAYKKAPFFGDAYPLVELCFLFKENNLFDFIFNSILEIKKYLNIETRIVISSSLGVFDELRGADKVLGIAKSLNANVYKNPIGGIGLYSEKKFQTQGVGLKFIKSRYFEYDQLGNEFVPWLSIIDVAMFNDFQSIKKMLSYCDEFERIED